MIPIFFQPSGVTPGPTPQVVLVTDIYAPVETVPGQFGNIVQPACPCPGPS